MFKSASLGFDVLKGNRNPQRTIPADLTKLPEAGEAQKDDSYTPNSRQNRWCRLYWTNGDQNLSLNSQGKVIFKGNAIAARSEPMILANGDLIDYPKGNWCFEPKQVAASLQKQANPPSITTNKTLKDLRQLAEIQNFIAWAKNNGIETTNEFTEEIKKFNTPIDFEVPKWTSGIKTDPLPLMVQLEENYKGSIFPSVHVGGGSTQSQNCMVKIWNERERVFPENSINRDFQGIWRSSDQQGDVFIDSWMRNLALRISTECGGKTLSAITPKNKTPATNRSFGIIPHPIYEPIEIHGGVMFGIQKNFLDKAKDDGLLLSPSRQMLYQQDKADAHFWRFWNTEKYGVIGQHIIVKDGKVTQISTPREGFIQFEVETTPSSIIRQEMRAEKTDTFKKGVEWFGAKSEDDNNIYEKAAWACRNAGEDTSPCIGIADISSDSLFQSYISGGRKFSRLIFAERQADNKWIIEINITDFAKDFDKRWEEEKSSDMNSKLSLIFNYSKWGFYTTAFGKYEQIVGDADFVDTILRNALGNSQR